MPQLDQLRDRLVSEGESSLAAPPTPFSFTGSDKADALIKDLDGHPHAFLFACLVDRQVTAERAWMVPSLVRERNGGLFEMGDLEQLTEADRIRLMREPTAAHRLPETMARVLHRAVARLVSHYDGDASRIWAGKPSSAALVRRVLEFHGAGPKIACMAGNLLVRLFRVPLSDYRYLDISADTQVRRVMTRLGFVEEGSDVDVVIYAARELNPDFPGIFDLAVWDIGRTVCEWKTPRCPECRLRDLCAYAVARRGG